MVDRFAAFDRAIARSTEPLNNFADQTLAGLDFIQQRKDACKAQIEKERKAATDLIKQVLGDG